MKVTTKISPPSVENKTTSSRTLVIGDIHGALGPLLDVMEKCNYSEEDKLIVMGDLCDGYPESAQVMEYFYQMHLTREIIFIKGNHDEWLEEFLFTGIPDKHWLTQGGKATIESYNKLLGEFPEKLELHSELLRKFIPYYIDERNRIFVHGGFYPQISISANKKLYGNEVFMWDRDLVEYAAQKSEVNVSFIPTDEGFSEIFVGHTSTTQYKTTQPLNLKNLWMLDTGAGWNGKLTVMDVNTKEYWQSDYSHKYYPDHVHE